MGCAAQASRQTRAFTLFGEQFGSTDHEKLKVLFELQRWYI